MKFAKIETDRNEKNPITGGFETADYVFWCEGCKCHHGVWTTKRNGNQAIWQFNNDLEKPTVTPSLLVHWKLESGDKVCHSFINNGNIQYLSDCTHKLAGKTVEIKDI